MLEWNKKRAMLEWDEQFFILGDWFVVLMCIASVFDLTSGKVGV